ncbi:type I polyketide synthase [Mycolicibacter sinensis]|nr:type I polyketide synthase [Mycolicibacter sinensis]
MSTNNEVPPNAIAVVGMAGRFPGARTLTAFWDNLRRGTESIVTLSEDELRAAGVSDKALANHNYVRRAALLEGIEEFDAGFFGFTPLAARTMDPQHRLFLQTAWHALEDAGYQPGELEGSVGVYGTSTTSGYLLHNLMSHYDPNQIIGQGVSFDMVNLSLQNDKDYLATRVAHQLNLRGPALSVQTACSSALVAVHLACQSILNGECDMALAGGASLRIPHHVGYWHEPGSMVSATGHCRPFDVRADGTIFSSGVGVVVLKSLADAVDDGDRIHAVIRGSALNNDGATKMTYAAPTAAGQADVIAEAHAVAEVDASTISYIESHGTGTPLGDPIEIEGLRQAFAVSEEERSGPCYVGSVKSNIGHLESAAGIASLIKTILCLKHRAIPGTLHYTSPNPELHLDSGPFRIRSEYGPWESDGIRRAGVSSFGVGGTNAHVILEEWAEESPVGAAPQAGPQVLLLSARTAEALQQGRSDLAAELSGGADTEAPNLTDVAYSLARRKPENLRLAAVVADRADAVTVLGAEESENVFIGEGVTDASETDRVVFLFPGQGAQHIGMARGLYDTEPVFAEYFDRCVAGFDAELGFDLRALIFDGTSRDLERTDRTQPALFTVEYALAKLIESYGVRPAALVGHSIGEYAAATVAGVFDLDTAIKVVAMRARLMHAAPRGVMVAVPLSPDAVGTYLTGDVDLAAVNDPDGCVVAGSEEAIRAFSDALKQAGINARRVRTSHAFHSRLMESMIPEFTGFLSRQTLHEPRIPLLSNLTGTQMAASEATNPATWARSVRATVRFADEIDTLLNEPHRVLVEVGPGATLTASAARHPKFADGHRTVRLMRHHAQNRDDRDTFLLALGQLWAAGVDVDWSGLRGDYQPKRVTVPGYPFERQRHWLEHNAGATWVSGAVNNGAAASGAGSADGAGGSAGSSIEATLQRIWGICLGVGSVDRNANFFDIGGDSLVAISVAMAASHEGMDLTPQDLYDNPTVAALAKALTARYAAGGLARQSPGSVEHPPVPPNITYFLENGVREHGHWRIPLILRLRPDVSVDDVRSVLTAVVNHHDALRLRITERAGTWEQHIAEPGEFGEIGTHSLPEGLTAEHDAVRTMLAEHIREQDLSCPPLTALYIRGSAGDVCYLGLSLHATVGDEASRDILLTDIFTAFGQKLAGNDIELAPVGVGWAEWSQRCAGLATHPAVLESREYWVQAAKAATLRLGAEVAEPPAAADLSKLTSSMAAGDTSEIDDARRRLRLPINEILLAGLSRALAATVGAGTVAVDIGGAGRSVLKPDVDLRRTVGWFTTIYPVALSCSTEAQATARQLLDEVHETLGGVPHYGIGYGLLRYLYAPTARLFSSVAPADIHFAYVGAIPELPSLGDAPVQFDRDIAMPVREAIPGLGHALELRAYRTSGVLHLDWWFDSRRIEESVVSSIADGFSTAVMDLVREAIAEDDLATTDAEDGEMTLVELS